MARFFFALITLIFVSASNTLAVEAASWGEIKAISAQNTDMPAGKLVVSATKAGGWRKSGLYHVTVDYSQSLAEIVAAGEYDWADTWFEFWFEHSSVTGSGQTEVDITLLHFGREVAAEEVLADMERRDYRPVTLPELLAFGAQYPDVQRELTVIALGSTLDMHDRYDNRGVPLLRSDIGGRTLWVTWLGFGWREGRYTRAEFVSGEWFAAVRK